MSQRGLSPLEGGSMLVYYTATKKPSVTPCGTMYLYLPKEWGFTAGELVNVNMTQDEERLVSDALKTYQLNHPARDVWLFAIKFGVWLERNYRKE